MGKRMHGWASRMDRGLFPFMGPAQVGAGHPEAPYERPAAGLCPVCGLSLAAHVVERGDAPGGVTRLICPTRD